MNELLPRSFRSEKPVVPDKRVEIVAAFSREIAVAVRSGGPEVAEAILTCVSLAQRSNELAERKREPEISTQERLGRKKEYWKVETHLRKSCGNLAKKLVELGGVDFRGQQPSERTMATALRTYARIKRDMPLDREHLLLAAAKASQTTLKDAQPEAATLINLLLPPNRLGIIPGKLTRREFLARAGVGLFLALAAGLIVYMGKGGTASEQGVSQQGAVEPRPTSVMNQGGEDQAAEFFTFSEDDLIEQDRHYFALLIDDWRAHPDKYPEKLSTWAFPEILEIQYGITAKDLEKLATDSKVTAEYIEDVALRMVRKAAGRIILSNEQRQAIEEEYEQRRLQSK